MGVLVSGLAQCHPSCQHCNTSKTRELEERGRALDEKTRELAETVAKADALTAHNLSLQVRAQSASACTVSKCVHSLQVRAQSAGACTVCRKAQSAGPDRPQPQSGRCVHCGWTAGVRI